MKRRPLSDHACLRLNRMMGITLMLALMFLSGALSPMVQAAVVPAGNTRNCQSCHDDFKYRAQFSRSVHGKNSCTSCHKDITDIGRHMTGQIKPRPVDCGLCHAAIAADFSKNFHYVEQNFRCNDCHREIHALPPAGANFKLAVIEKCTECHVNEEYVVSGHGEAVVKGNQDAATCSDCHGLHDTRIYHTSVETYPGEAREFYSRKCIRCHSDPGIIRRNKLNPKIVAYYEQTYHGKVHDVGYPTRVAGCADCHSSHDILPKQDVRSSIHPANLADNCGRCHQGFHPRFVDYKAHPDFRDRERYPVLFWTFVFMSGLLVFTFGFFWVHTFLWWRKVYWEQHRMEKLGIVPDALLAKGEGLEQVERFAPEFRLLHVLLIVSFFVLVLTGFPLKYHETAWSGPLMRLWGGAQAAGWFHRGAALLLTALFLFVAWRSLCYLFPKGQGTRGWVSRLLSPDSLFPRWKDWEDIQGMFRWFFNRGPMPRFDRWTYWEKFDFWAVFWGMFAIGISGVLLWVPELSSYIVPGWVMNVATVVHSEEALLAAIFIFTVHFFNTHFIPTKFPMDRIIFTGTYRLEELKEQKPLEYERIIAEGRLEGLKRRYPGIPLKLISAAFGLASLLLGLFLTVLIGLAFLVYG